MQNKVIIVDGGRSHYDQILRSRIAALSTQQINSLHHAAMSAGSQPADASGEAGAGSPQQNSGDGSGEDDGGDGDSDEDGPRLPSSHPPLQQYSPSFARPYAAWRQHTHHLDSHAPHRRALNSLVLLTLALLAAALIFGLTGHEYLAAEAMGMACGLPRLARSLVKQK